MATTEIISALLSMEESPWGELKGKPITPRALANLLKPYGVSSTTIRLTEDNAVIAKWYKK